MISRSNRDIVCAVMAIVGPAVAIAQNAPPAPRFQGGTELVALWTDPVLQWNAVTLAIATAAGKDPVAQQRILSIVHLAIFEAVNAITGDFEPYLGSIGATPGASPARPLSIPYPAWVVTGVGLEGSSRGSQPARPPP
jgi:hypothetical protein